MSQKDQVRLSVEGEISITANGKTPRSKTIHFSFDQYTADELEKQYNRIIHELFAPLD